MNALAAVWDTSDRFWFTAPEQQARTDWLKAHNLPADDMFRAEFYAYGDDGPFVRVFTFHLDEHGKKHLTDDRKSPAENPPYDVPLAELPPRSILGGSP